MTCSPFYPSLFPIAVLVVELPHVFASYRTWVFGASLASWPLLYLAAGAPTGQSGSVQSLVDTIGCVAVASIMGLLSNVNSVKARICFYVAFYFAMDVAMQYPSAFGVVSEGALLLWKTPALACCGLTLLGYALSLPFGHPFVFSRALGGSGVEPMTLLPLGTGPNRSNIAGGRIMI
ncbi:uncharacterized protein CTRU02_201449 [Colletotrichum truncatum]|uniref:Uncharacterized protein n=1 Tax=Colletotrichum truncatum TaxID=5467 RepID=A0ACC3ZHC5_COLTU|nr:uncharacterized protein CTRU02_14320 [Colletotrichum truncatum]KAF6782281.1 hypothetical protein CTRU02_14320 [Colletotrichum truncatum]